MGEEIRVQFIPLSLSLSLVRELPFVSALVCSIEGKASKLQLRKSQTQVSFLYARLKRRIEVLSIL